MFFYQTILWTYLLSIAFSNLVWGGDFQYDQGPFGYAGIYHFHIQPYNVSTWYDITLNNIQIRWFDGVYTTKTVDLSSDFPYTLCQNITLKIGSRYRMSYDLYNQPLVSNGNVTVYLNNQLISNVYIPNPSSFATQTDFFQSNDIINQLCFNETYSGPAYSATSLDNITLYQFNQYWIKFYCFLQQKTSNIILISNITYEQSIAVRLIAQYRLSAYSQQFNNFQCLSTQDGNLSIIISVNFSLFTNQLKFNKTNNSYINETYHTYTLFYLTIQFYGKQSKSQQYYHALNQNQKDTILTGENLLKTVGTFIAVTYSFKRFSFCSYFLLTLISFENLSLFYIFMNIPIIPNFIYQIYYELLNLQFQLSDIENVIQNIFNLTKNPFQFVKEKQKITELVQDKIDSFNWFGTYGFSSLFINNNSANFIILLLLLIKIFVLKQIFKCLGSETINKIRLTSSFDIVFLTEFIINIPSFVIPAVLRIRIPYSSFYQKIQMVFQFILIFFCLISLSLYPVLKLTKKQNIHNKLQNKKLRMKRKLKYKQKFQRLQLFKKSKNSAKLTHLSKYCCNQTKLTNNYGQKTSKSSKSIKKKAHLKYKNNFIVLALPKSWQSNQKATLKNKKQIKFYNFTSDTLIIFTIPFLICFNQPLYFLIMNSFAIGAKVIAFYNNYEKRPLLRNVLQFLINLVWVLHHCIFIAFYILNKKNNQENFMEKSDYSQMIIILGICSIFTVLIGCMLEIAKLLLWVKGIIMFFIKKIKNKCRQNQKNKIHIKKRLPVHAETRKQRANRQPLKQRSGVIAIKNRKISKNKFENPYPTYDQNRDKDWISKLKKLHR